MSRTLFWYIFRDLLRIFLMASVALAGIMSFAGLLRPMTENGLDAGQIGRILFFFMPAMATYSLPVAALFATTMVYGRLSSDNELTACRAGGISYLAIATPALMLGLVVAILSLLFLCFVVPLFTVRIEKVVYSNIAQLVANQIERRHRIELPGREPVTVFAEAAKLQPPTDANQDCVSLKAPMIVMYENGVRPLKPKEFWMASRADAFIRHDSKGSNASLSVTLRDGVRIPREVKGEFQGGVEVTQFGPLPIPSQIRENTKFMDIHELRRLYLEPEQSRAVKTLMENQIVVQQQLRFMMAVRDALKGPASSCTLTTAGQNEETFIIGPGVGSVEARFEEMHILSSDPQSPKLQFLQMRGGQTVLSAMAKRIRLQPRTDSEPGNERFVVTVDLGDALIRTGDMISPRATFSRSFVVPMPESIRQLRQQSVEQFMANPDTTPGNRDAVYREMIVVSNRVQGEMHARSSFAVSCLILVMVGCALGMMFRSGDFLSAFAVSFVPAILSITLIVAGQQTGDHVPWDLHNFHNPLHIGLSLIWSGNLINLVLAVLLLGRLQRQ